MFSEGSFADTPHLSGSLQGARPGCAPALVLVCTDPTEQTNSRRDALSGGSISPVSSWAARLLGPYPCDAAARVPVFARGPAGRGFGCFLRGSAPVDPTPLPSGWYA